MTPSEMKARTKQFALRSIKLCDALPHTRSGNAVAHQLIGSATSVGANYRAACRARSSADFISKMGIALEEVDESIYWMELAIEAGMLPRERIDSLLAEGNELVAILVASLNTARKRRRQSKSPIQSAI